MIRMLAIPAERCAGKPHVEAYGQHYAAVQSLQVQQPREGTMKSGTLEQFGTLKAMATLHVLIVADSRDDVELILLELREAGLRVDYTTAENREQFRRALQQENLDAIFSDYRLPSWTGLEALHELQETGRDIPFLLVTGTLGEEAAVECMKQGATDYIVKDRISRLPVALKRAIGEKAPPEETNQTP